MGEISRRLGRPFMPWQQHVMDIALEIDPGTGELWYSDVTLTVPRQQGKTSLVLPRVVWRAEAAHMLGGRQHMLYTAQTGTAAKAKWEKEFVEDLDSARVMAGRYRVIRQPNHERVRFQSGSTFGPIAPMPTAGHGDVLDDGTIDEAFSRKNDDVEQAWSPAMLTRGQSQLWTPSTAGPSKASSPYLWGRILAGRSLVESGVETRSAHFEWAADPAADPEDPDTWFTCMPALGRTVRVATVKHRLQRMLANPKQGLPAFRRAYLNQWADDFDVEEWGLPKASWKACRDPRSRRAAGARPSLGVDMSPDRARSSVAFAAPRADGLPMGMVIRNGDGSGWVAREVADEARRTQAVCVVLDGTGPASNLVEAIERELRGACPVLKRTAAELPNDCATMKDSVVTEQFRHVGQPELDAAVRGAVEIKVNDRFKYGRRAAGADISPFYSVVLAAAGLAAQPESKYEGEGFTTL